MLNIVAATIATATADRRWKKKSFGNTLSPKSVEHLNKFEFELVDVR